MAEECSNWRIVLEIGMEFSSVDNPMKILGVIYANYYLIRTLIVFCWSVDLYVWHSTAKCQVDQFGFALEREDGMFQRRQNGLLFCVQSLYYLMWCKNIWKKKHLTFFKELVAM